MLNDILHFAEYERKDENRRFHDSLSIDINLLDNFPGDYENFLNDNFSFRTPLLNMFHDYKYKVFNVAPYPKTIIGNDEWFFLAREEVKVYKGLRNFNEEKLNRFSTEWAKRKKYFDSLDIKYYWVIAPLKHNIYTEELPFNVLRHKVPHRTDQIINELRDSFPNLITYPKKELIAAKEKYQVYHKLDNHWNERGGHLVAELLINKIQADFPDKKVPDLPNYEWKDSTFSSGFHYRSLGQEQLVETEQIPTQKLQRAEGVPRYGFPSPAGFKMPKEYEFRYQVNSDSAELKILFIRDSFGKDVFPFLKESFKETLVIFDDWKYQLNEAIIEKMEPDIVVYLSIESLTQNMIREKY